MTHDDWSNLKAFIAILKPFHSASMIEQGDSYVTISASIPIILTLNQKMNAYVRNPDNIGYGIGFAKKILASLEDRFGRNLSFLEKKPYCLATFADPRFFRVYYSNDSRIEAAREKVIGWVKEETENSTQSESSPTSQPSDNANEPDEFWGWFDSQQKSATLDTFQSIDSEISSWGKSSALSRNTDPIHAMNGLKRDFPSINHIFGKYCVILATQNADELLFSIEARNTGPLCRSIKI